jgi:phage shock protein C
MKNESSTEPKRLYRSKKDKVIAGVCGGIAEYFNVDPVWVRLIAVLLALLNGVGIILYIIAWILVPKNPVQGDTKQTVAEKTADKIAKKVEKKRGKAGLILGLIFVLLGFGLLLKNLFTWFNFNYVWPVLVIILGLFFIFIGRKEE